MQLPSLISQWVAKEARFLLEDSKDSDQTARMRRLIRVFAGHTGHFVCFVVLQFKYAYILVSTGNDLFLKIIYHIFFFSFTQYLMTISQWYKFGPNVIILIMTFKCIFKLHMLFYKCLYLMH